MININFLTIRISSIDTNDKSLIGKYVIKAIACNYPCGKYAEDRLILNEINSDLDKCYFDSVDEINSKIKEIKEKYG